MATRTTVFRMGRRCNEIIRLWDFANKDASRIFSSTSTNKSDGQAPMELLLHGHCYCNWRLSALYRSAVVSLTLPDIDHLLLDACCCDAC